MVISIRKEGLNVGIYDFRYTIIGREGEEGGTVD